MWRRRNPVEAETINFHSTQIWYIRVHPLSDYRIDEHNIKIDKILKDEYRSRITV